jgi:hypothetical protein
MSLTTKVSSSFWSDEDIGGLPADQKLAVLWVLTCKDRNNLGLVKVGKRQFEFDTGEPLSTLHGALKVLARSFAFRVVDNGLEVLALNFIRYQFADVQSNPTNRIYKHLCTHLSLADEWVKEAILARYKGLAWGLSSLSPLEGASMPLQGTRAEQSRATAEQSRAEPGGMEGGTCMPTDAEVRSWALSWPGELATGTPKFPENFVNDWLGRMNGRTMGWPVDWKRAIVSDWRAKHRTWGKGGKGPAGSVYDLKDRLRALEACIASHPANEASASAIGRASEEEHEELRKMRAERTALTNKLAGSDV